MAGAREFPDQTEIVSISAGWRRVGQHSETHRKPLSCIAIGGFRWRSPTLPDGIRTETIPYQTSRPTARIRARALLWRTTPGRIR